ncbi:MAG: phosphocholine cytidylyltransferase family protein, partial [Acidobacteria bacterium]|nr:phosphocholine cytidylyltransferase family protein [Acidobacteriota bacterium]
KCLLEIGRRRLIEHQLDTLAESGVGPAGIIVGYGADEVRELVGMRAEYIQSSRWASTNSLYSFWLARDWVKGDVMVLNCDVLFSRQIIERLLDAPGDAIAVDRSSGSGREQMKVECAGDRLVAMSKNMTTAERAGENVGILKLTEATAHRLFQRAGELLEAGREKDWLGAAVNSITAEVPLKVVDIAGLPWIEIDFSVDLARARREVWPAIQRMDSRWRSTWRGLRWAAAGGLIALALATSPLLSMLAPQTQQEWDSLPIENLQPTHINLDTRSQGWWLMGNEEIAEVGVAPGPVRIESRLLDRPGDEARYVLETVLDDGPADYHKLTTRPSGKATHEKWLVSHKERITLQVPEGAHTLQVRLLAPPRTDCLTRIRQPEPVAGD